MDLAAFKLSLENDEAQAPTAPLRALWVEARGDWHGAHGIVQSLDSADASWVHAYLHRKEGDQSNAGYWYRRAGKSVSRESLDAEWDEIATALLDDGDT